MNSPEKEKREQETYESFFAGSDQQKSSLRPQPNTVSIKDAVKFGNLEYERGVKDGLNHHWKPSEEQMDSLLWCIAHLGGADHRVLAELYEHLKKL